MTPPLDKEISVSIEIHDENDPTPKKKGTNLSYQMRIE